MDGAGDGEIVGTLMTAGLEPGLPLGAFFLAPARLMRASREEKERALDFSGSFWHYFTVP